MSPSLIVWSQAASALTSTPLPTSPSVEGAQGEHPIVKLLDPLDADRDLLPCGLEGAPEVHEARSTAIDLLRVHEATRGVELKLGREVVEYPFEVTPLKASSTPHARSPRSPATSPAQYLATGAVETTPSGRQSEAVPIGPVDNPLAQPL